MARNVARWGVVLLLAGLTLGVAGAAGRSLVTTTTVVVQVMGGGLVTGGGGQINCGGGSESCYATYSVSGTTVKLDAHDAGDWTFNNWDSSDRCAGSSST